MAKGFLMGRAGWKYVFLGASVVSLGVPCGGCHNGADGDIQAVARRALPAAVKISTLGWGKGSGSGFVVRGVDGSEVVVTNSHVVVGASSVTIELADGHAVPASIMGSDPAIDLAILRPASRIGVVPLSLEDDRNLEVGDRLMIIGNPAGLTGVVTTGILHEVPGARRHASWPGASSVHHHGRRLDSGSSGSPVLDKSGRVVGVSSALVGTGRGLSIVLPGHVAARVAVELQRSGAYSHSYVGMDVTTAPPEERRDGACLVTAVAPGGPAMCRRSARATASPRSMECAREAPRNLMERGFWTGPGRYGSSRSIAGTLQSASSRAPSVARATRERASGATTAHCGGPVRARGPSPRRPGRRKRRRFRCERLGCHCAPL